MLPRSRHFLSSGFALTELLVVIVIVAFIAAPSFLGIGRMRDVADETGVVSSVGVPNARHAHSVSTLIKPSQSMAFASATDLGVRYRSRLTWFSEESDNREMRSGNRIDDDLSHSFNKFPYFCSFGPMALPTLQPTNS
jgi:prepilin-type N-terminal cleavage/methylation domain-containing protein